MRRLQTIAPDDSVARIETIEALGRTRDPVVLRALLLVAGAGSKHVRRAVAVALSGINHTLSAYILLPMLEDQSSRVRNSAIQALIYIDQPHTAESIISACLGNRELKRIAFDTLPRLRPIQREAFIHRLAQVNSGGSVTASDLIREFRSVANSLPSAGPAGHADLSGQPNAASQQFGNSDFRAARPTPESSPTQRPSSFDTTRGIPQSPERPVFEPARSVPEQTPGPDRKQGSADRFVTAEEQRAQVTLADSQFEIPVPAPPREESSARVSEEIATRYASPQTTGFQANASSGNINREIAGAHTFAESSYERLSRKSDNFVNHGIDVSSLDDLAVGQLMSELVPGTPGVRSSDSVADFRFFESVSTNLNDSHAGWQSPENSVFDYDPAEEFAFSDTQSFNAQNTNRSDFAFAANTAPNSFGSSASGSAPELNSTGSSASWNMRPPMTPSGNSFAQSRAMSPVAGDHSRSGSHVSHPPQNFPAAPAGATWPPMSQNQPSAAYPPPQMYQWPTPAPIPALNPQYFSPLPPQMTMPPAAFPMAPPMPTPGFAPMGTDPAIALMKSSAEMATFGQPNPMAASMSNVSQPAVVTAAPLSEDVLLNGGTMLEIPMIPASGTMVATTDAQSSAPIELTVTTTVQPDDSEKAAKKAQGERNLERLRQARDHAFHALLENPESISGTVPRLISKKITTLLTTQAGDHAQIKQQLVALGKTGSPHVLETLASFCQKPVKEIRISCAEALGMVKHQGSLVQLLKFLGDKSGTVIETALKSMISLQDKVAYPVILAAGLVNSSLRTIVSSSIETVGEEFKPAWEQQLLSYLTQNDPDLVAFSIQLLVKLTGATHVDSFMGFAENTESVIRAAAIEALVKTGAKKVIGTINVALEDQDPLVRAQAAAAVGTMHSPRSIDLLGKLLLDSNLSVRRSAAQSAAKIEEPDLGDAIIGALKVETDHLVIEYLLEALNKNGGKDAYSLLVQFVEGTDTELRELALKALRKLKLQESIPVFTRLLDDKHPHIRKQAIEQLALLKSNGVIPRLKQMVKADTDEHVRGACARALGDLQDKTSLDLLEAALEDHAVVRFQAVLALGKIGNSAAGPSLLALLRDSQPEIRYQAVRALGQLKLVGSEVHLEPLLQDSDVMVRRGVEQTLQEFGMTPGQIRRMRFQKSFSKAILAISPSYIFAALPGKAGSAVAVLTMVLAVGGVWLLSNFGAMVSGGATLPVTRVVSVAVSSAQKKAFVLRKMDVFDVWSISDGAMVARVKAPLGASQIIPESKGGVLLVGDALLTRLDASNSYEPENAKSLELNGKPFAVYFDRKSNSVCLFEKQGGGVQLSQIDASTLGETKKWSTTNAFAGNCIVSPDLKYAASLTIDGTLTFWELESGKVLTANVAKLANKASLGRVIDMTFSDDMKYFAFCGTEGVYCLKVSNMSLVKKVTDGRAYVVLLPESGTSNLMAIAESGNLLKLSDELKAATDTPLGGLSELNGFDADGEVIVSGSSEGRGVSIYSIKENKTVLEIQPE